VNFANFLKKFKLPDERGFELTENRRAESFLTAPRPTLIHKLSIPSVVWNISIGQLGLAAWLYSLQAPAHLMFS